MVSEHLSDGKQVIHDGRFRVGFFVRKISQKNQSIWQAMCPDPMLTSVQAGAMTVLYHHGPRSLSELGGAAAIDLSTVRGVVERLRARKLVSLRKDESDARKVVVELTQAGRKLVLGLIPVMRTIADATLEPLNAAERVAFQYLVQKIIGSLADDEA